MATFKVGIVGTGSIGQTHAKVCQATPGVQVKAIAELVPERARSFAKQFEIPDLHLDYRDMVKDPAIDAVIVCVPNALHAPVSVAALEAGKHVLIEKPLGLNAAAATQIVEAHKATGKTAMVALNNRFRPEIQLAKQYVQEECGELYYGRAAWIRRRGIPGWGSWFTRKDLSGGGPLIDIGVHMLDLCLDFFGYPDPVSVVGSTYAKFGPEKRGIGTWGVPDFEKGYYDVEDMASAHIRLASGGAINLEVSWALETDDREWVEVMGTRGGVRVSGGQVQVFTERFGRPVDMFPNLPPGDQRTNLMQHFVHCCATGEEPLTSLRHGLVLNQVFDAIYASGAQGGRQIMLGM